MVFTDFSSNITSSQVRKSLKYILNPFNWSKLYSGKETKKLKEKLNNKIGSKSCFLLDSGRSAIYLALESSSISKGDEVIVPAYTCSVVINAVRWTGAKPVLVDINDNFNINPSKIKEKITDNTKAIVAHHTFGSPLKVKEIKKIAEENKLLFIEDCAHGLGGKIDGEEVGSFGDISIFSFGANKVISSVRGGAICINDVDKAQELSSNVNNLDNFPVSKVLKYILHSILFHLGRGLYSIYFGKLLFKLFKTVNLLPMVISKAEKKGKKPGWTPAVLPNVLADFALNQFNQLDSFNNHRKKISEIYRNKLPDKILPEPIKNNKRIVDFKFPILVDEPYKLHKEALNKGFQLSLSWTGSSVVPTDSLPNFCYNKKTKGEKTSQKILLLPTNINISKNEAKELSDLISKNYS
ncbi:MAG: aminotransferase class I/II-fold pyridoxal phosphate-dependent enzyme [Candidatus Magasanikbacteria bacterium]